MDILGRGRGAWPPTIIAVRPRSHPDRLRRVGSSLRRGARVAPIGIGLALAACGAGASSPTNRAAGQQGGGGGQSAPARDTFTGSIVSGTGAYAGSHGPVKIYLHPHGSRSKRSLRTVIRGECSASARGCTMLAGAMTGTLERSGHMLPDVGDQFILTGEGRVSPLGQASGSGTVGGTGFIARGHALLDLKLTGNRGSVEIRALSGGIGGFTSP